MTRSGMYGRVSLLITLIIVGGLIPAPASAVNILELYPPPPDPRPSVPPPAWGACCWHDGTCTMTLPEDCSGVYWGGPLTACAGQDCNTNGVDDFCDIANMYSPDCDQNGVPDECQPFEDCNDNGGADFCDLAGCAGGPWCSDCNANQVLDQCDIASGTSPDVLPPGGDGIPDECQDCNGNSILDDVDIANGTSQDCNGNSIPDECDIANGTSQDCNANGVPDQCDLVAGTSQDCNGNSIPDECDIADGTSLDVLPPGGDGIPDECQSDCNGNLIPDNVDIASGTSPDCNANGIPDECDIAAGTSPDCNGNGVPDECDIASGTSQDCNQNSVPDECDIALGTSLDANGDGIPDECEQIHNVTQDTYFFRIQWALDAAAGGDEIIVAPGTYPEAINFLGKAVYLHSLDGAAVTTIDATGLNASVVTCANSEGPGTVLEGFTITGGSTGHGGGMHNGASSPTVTNCKFSGNSAYLAGGGMYNEGSSPTVTNCTFSGNSATDGWDGYGGGMANDGSSPTVTNCIFSGNFAAGFWAGGGMRNEFSNPIVTNCTFSGNSACYGGGMENCTSSPTVTQCTFSGNSATGWLDSCGGGMDNWLASSPIVIHCTFSGNSATGWWFSRGGGMVNDVGSVSLVTDCTFSGNSAWVGAGLVNWYGSSPTVVHCMFSGNSALGGAGMYNYYCSPTVTNCTFSGNEAALGGGMYNDAGSPTVTNCILWGDALDEFLGAAAVVTYSDVEGGYAGSGNIDADPLFVRPPSDGGDGWGDNPDTPDIDEGANDDYGDLHLSAGSPCIDAGDNTVVPAWLLADLDGKPRFWDDPNTPDTGNPDGLHPLADLGPYEFGSEGCPDDDGDGFVTLCHIPPGHPEQACTISVPVQAAPTHLAHGDYCGPCGGGACCYYAGGCDVVPPEQCDPAIGLFLGAEHHCFGCPCFVVPCPPEGIPEAEPCGSDTNGGCNAVVWPFEPIECGTTVCGTMWANTSLRDTDWYQLTLTEGQYLTWSASSQVPLLIFIIQGAGPNDCSDYTILASATARECQTAAIGPLEGAPGVTYWFWAGPSAWSNWPCDKDYSATLTCAPVPTGACCLLSATCVETTPGGCAAQSGQYQGDDLSCADVVCIPFHCNASGGCDEYIANVQIDVINNPTPCTMYGDYTALGPAVLPIGVGTPLTVTNGNPIWTSDTCSVWVDWNLDYIVDDVTELIGDIPGVGPYNFTLTPPAGAVFGPTRMRIRIDYANPDPNPCGPTTYGEVEDYSVVVQEVLGACCGPDGSCTSEPPSNCGGYWAGPFTQCAGADCNGSGADDLCDIVGGYSLDCDSNGVPDECQPADDCNGNGIQDFCDIANGTSCDCNENGVPDECDVANGTSLDCQPDGIPDECQLGEGLSLQIDDGTSENGWGLTAGGELCWIDHFVTDYPGRVGWIGVAFGSPAFPGTSGVTPGQAVRVYVWSDPNQDGNPQDAVLLGEGTASVDVGSIDTDIVQLVQLPGTGAAVSGSFFIGASVVTISGYPATADDDGWTGPPDQGFLTSNSVPFDPNDIADNLYPMSWLGYPTTVFLLRVGGDSGCYQDCNENGIPDFCDMPPPFGNCQGPDCSQDCQPNGIPDECDIAYGVSPDCNSNAIPDECDIGAGTSTDVNGNGVPDECESVGDLNCDGVTDLADINPLVLYLSNNAQWLAVFPGCNPLNGDINGDGTYGQWSFDDINPFVALLTGG